MNKHNPAKQLTSSRKSIIIKIGVLFVLLLSVIIGNGIFSIYHQNQDAFHHIQSDIARKLDITETILSNEKEKLDVIAGIVKGQQLTIVNYMDYDMIRPIKIMLQTISSKHDVEMLFLFDENKELLATNSFKDDLRTTSDYSRLLNRENEQAILTEIPVEIISEQFSGAPSKYNGETQLCFTSTIHLTHDLGNIYGYVVLIKPITYNQAIQLRLQKLLQSELVIFDKHDKPVLSTFDTSPANITYPQGKEYTLNGKSYLNGTQRISAADGQNIATIMVAIDKQSFFQHRNRLIINITPPFIATVLIALVFFLLLKTGVIDKINHLRSILRSVATGDGNLGSRLEVIPEGSDSSRMDEVQLMCHDFNQMMDMLESTFEQTEKQADLLTKQKNEMTSLYKEHRLILDSAAEGIYGIDIHGNTTFVNKAALALTGFREEELLGRNPHQLIHHSEMDGRLLPYEQCPVHISVIRQKVIRVLEHLFWKKDGKSFPVEYVCSPIVKNDTTRGAVIVFKDITERIEAEKRLREEQAFSDAVVNSIPGAFYVFDEQLRMLKWNAKLESITGYSSQELYGTSIYDFFSSDDRDRIEKALQKLSDEGSITIEARAITKNGQTIPFFVSACLLNIDSKNLIVGIGLDISERKKIEAEFRQIQKMEAIGTLAGGIAHDFNNILSPIIGYAEIGEMTLSKSHAFYPQLTAIHDAARRAKNLVQQILTFSRIREHKISPLIVQPIIKESLKFLRSSLPTTITIRENIDNECGSILADPTQIQQIMMNLCTNAFHAMEEKGGTLTITLNTSNLSEHECKNYNNILPGSYLHLAVSDTGTGMNRKTRERIFEPFFTTKSEGKGTGMGLAVVHGIITSYGGTILIESQPGEGTCFDIFIPHTEMDIPQEVHESYEALPCGTEHIMLVDDQEFVASIEYRLLETLGYTVSTFMSSNEALEAFKKSPDRYDLVLTDQTMPDMTGAVLSSKILDIRPDIPIILCSGNDTFTPGINIDEIGIRHFLMKPLELAQIATILRKALDGARPDSKSFSPE